MTQVAVAVAVLPAAGYYAVQSAVHGTVDPGYPADQFLRARLEIEGAIESTEGTSTTANAVADSRLVDRAAELMLRLESEAEVAGVTFASSFPGSEPGISIEIDGASGGAVNANRRLGVGARTFSSASINRVGVDFFDVFDVPILAGRGFEESDAIANPTTVIVNRELAERIDAAGQPLGAHIRRVIRAGSADPANPNPAGPWLEIVGVVPNFPTPSFHTSSGPKFYVPVALEQAATVTLAIRTLSDRPAAFAPRLRALAVSVDPALELHELASVAEARRLDRLSMQGLALMVGGVTLSVVLLSAGGIYAMMSFTVARRRREIGIRAALGADPRPVLTGVFARAAGQLGVGALLGLVAGSVLARYGGGELSGDNPWIPLITVVVIMITVGLLAALGPARAGLAVEPSEALRAE